MSPARVDFADPAGGELKSSWRPQEALGLQVFDSAVRNVNANRTQPRQAGQRQARADSAFAITTGDLADNQQLNETRWFKTVLDGGTVDPFSGKPVTTECGNQSADTLARINADVAARNYTGVADYDDYRDAPAGPLRRLLRPGRGRADLRPVRRVPALPRPARGRPAPVPGGRPGHALVHLARQPRRPRPGQRARQRGPLPRDRRPAA